MYNRKMMIFELFLLTVNILTLLSNALASNTQFQESTLTISPQPPSWWEKPMPRKFVKNRRLMDRFKRQTTGEIFPMTCAERARFGLPSCCTGQDRNCYTASGCFCDVACFQHFGDCCSDIRDECSKVLNLCLYDDRPKPIRQPRDPEKLRANACCDDRPYNDLQRTCCNGTIVRQFDFNCTLLIR